MDPVAPHSQHACADLSARLGAFLDGSLDASGRESLRAHVRACGVCAPAYRAAVTDAALVARGLRERRMEALRDESARAQRRARRGAFAFFGGHTQRGSRLRLLILPGVFALLVFASKGGRGRAPTLELTWSAGEVWAQGGALGPAGESVRWLRRGGWCTTRTDGAASLVGDGARVELGPETSLLVESARGPRLRLESGALVLDGACVVTSPLGVIELERRGRARLSLGERGLELECLAGAARFHDPLGERRLRAGESLASAPGPR